MTLDLPDIAGFKPMDLEPVKETRKVYEKQSEERLCRKIKALGGKCLKWKSENNRGVLDRIILLPGHRFYMVEMKRKDAFTTGRLSTKQKQFIDELKDLGFRKQTYVIYGNEGVDQFVDMIKIEMGSCL
jgi:hypothetical protein